jgi:hypothetical protein
MENEKQCISFSILLYLLHKSSALYAVTDNTVFTLVLA